ncbi:hypothetical protein KDH_12270 [Dictyobacter sp. S3.2.2.5]|uniref:ABM domain-containing protein n=2 Tax=Dictyobacter halimunensis TaxID=3026934 RepID=A0ABQ6FLA8_9CHLR|nr:hypothetical protein KDH_12270 [Dictyobacter sp. S3.2.2.5]
MACAPMHISKEVREPSPDLQAREARKEDGQASAPPAEHVTPAFPERSAPAVVELIEQLRGRPYTTSERPRELKAAFALLNLAETPQLSLEEIRESWKHGSDDWWRDHYGDDVHVHDLVQKNAQGKRRVLAFLEHKRRCARFAPTSHRVETPYVPVQDTLTTLSDEPETYEFLACEADAAALAAWIEHEVQAQGYDAVARVEEDEYHPGVWYVQVEWWASTEAVKAHRVSSHEAWERYFAQQHAIIQYNTVSA